MRALTTLLITLILLFTTVTAGAQAPGAVCPGVVNEALQQLGTNCASMSRNSACYGFNNVDASFNVPVASGFFTQTNERAELMTIEALRTAPLDLVEDKWGVSLMNVQANLPDALPGQGVVFVLLGGVEVEGDVAAQDAVVPQATLQVNVGAATNLRSAPNTLEWRASDVLDSVPAEVTLPADAIDRTSAWVRVVYNGKPGWIDRSVIADDVSSLTVVGADSLTPMQAFFFRVGIGGVTCDEVPSLLAVQGPRNVAIDIQVDRVNVRVTSTIILQTFPPGDMVGDTLQLSTVSGLAMINPNTAEQIIVPPGYTIFIHLTPGVANLGIEGDTDDKLTEGNWFGLRPLTADELARFNILGGVPSNLLHYGITFPHVLGCSGTGGCQSQLIFEDQGALDGARRVCAAGLLPIDVCQYLGIT